MQEQQEGQDWHRRSDCPRQQQCKTVNLKSEVLAQLQAAQLVHNKVQQKEQQNRLFFGKEAAQNRVICTHV